MKQILFLLLLSGLSSCAHEHAEDEAHDHDHGTASAHSDDDGHAHETEEHAPGEIHLTRAQIETMQIELGDFSQIKINDYVQATGTLGLPPNALTAVSAKAAGFIKNSNKYVEGDYIEQGAVMAYLENPEFIAHQREYLETAATLTFDRQELQRQKDLVAADAGIERNVQKLQAEVNRKEAKMRGIAKQLSYLGISVERLTSENIRQRIAIYAPMSGYITTIKMHNGMYVTPQEELMEIVNEKHLHLELDVFEQDIADIAEKQRISYTVPALGGVIYEGEVNVIGKEFNRENKTVRVHGHLETERPRFIKDLFVEAKVWLNDQTVPALPDGAVVTDGENSYIYVTETEAAAEEIIFAQIPVLTKGGADGFTAVEPLEKLPAQAKIVTSGAYYVYAQSKAGELEHSH